ncbi:MAG: B12-binding domain-containing radical SAM protein [Chlorobiaceae bacterium]|nr:B12-binding domain-containing radical SAM protein [Chlorobiaceae bacterium]
MHTQHRHKNGVLLIGYENQENLGLRSIIAALRKNGHKAELQPFYPGNNQTVLEAINKLNPSLIGFSLIFQFTLEYFADLMRYLRIHGVTTHFTAGGHFPSLRPAETLELIPELDSIVRFEGEESIIDIYTQLEKPTDWSEIPGIAYRNGNRIIQTPLRPLIENLDDIPTVVRDESGTTTGGIKTAYMLASRGCHFNCSFCSIRQFYGTAHGKLRRTRSPHHVAEEMRELFTRSNVRFFSFQDDDFAARSPAQKQWIGEFLKELRKNGLSEKIKWKISCRVDDVEPLLFQEMASHGLFAVYLGVESGNETGLKTLNKQTSVRQNLQAIETLKEMHFALSAGFMLFDPSSTFASVKENIEFLSAIGNDGYFPINFGKMLPYAGTPIEQELRLKGRLKGTLTHPDYDFLDEDLDWYAFLVQKLFAKRNFGSDGVTALLGTDFEYRIAAAFELYNSPELAAAIKKNISLSNALAVRTLRKLLDAIASLGAEALLREENTIISIADDEWTGETQITVQNSKLRQKLHDAIETANLQQSENQQNKES